MTYRRLALFPFVWAAVFAFAAAMLPVEARGRVYTPEIECEKALAALGCFVAALTFERGEYMRRAWSFNGVCYLFLLARDVTLSLFDPSASIAGIPLHGVTGTFVLIGNLASVIGTWLLARAWSIAGLELPGSRGARLGTIAAAAAIAVAISGSDLYDDATKLFGGDVSTLHSVASDLGDIFGLCLVAPVLLTAIAMRGGVLKWPWGLLTASLLFWLCYDGVATLEHLSNYLADHGLPVRANAATMKLLREAFRALACVSEFSAGLAQRRTVTAEPVDA